MHVSDIIVTWCVFPVDVLLSGFNGFRLDVFWLKTGHFGVQSQKTSVCDHFHDDDDDDDDDEDGDGDGDDDDDDDGDEDLRCSHTAFPLCSSFPHKMLSSASTHMDV